MYIFKTGIELTVLIGSYRIFTLAKQNVSDKMTSSNKQNYIQKSVLSVFNNYNFNFVIFPNYV